MQHPMRSTLTDAEAARFVDELRDFVPQIAARFTAGDDPIRFCSQVISEMNAGTVPGDLADELRDSYARSIICPIAERREDPMWVMAREQRGLTGGWRDEINDPAYITRLDTGNGRPIVVDVDRSTGAGRVQL